MYSGSSHSPKTLKKGNGICDIFIRKLNLLFTQRLWVVAAETRCLSLVTGEVSVRHGKKWLASAANMANMLNHRFSGTLTVSRFPPLT